MKIYGDLDGVSLYNDDKNSDQGKDVHYCDTKTYGENYKCLRRQYEAGSKKYKHRCVREVKEGENENSSCIESEETKWFCGFENQPSQPNKYDCSCIPKEQCEIYIKYDGECENCILQPADGKDHLLEVRSFGRIGIKEVAFESAYNLKKVSTIDIPDSTKLLSLQNVFKNACSFNSPIENWDVSNVTTMEKTFWMPGCMPQERGGRFKTLIFPTFNQPLEKWDVSNVTDMSNMFGYAASFNQPLNDWNVSNVTDMAGMFGAYSDFIFVPFNQPLNRWDVSKVTTMQDMFLGAAYFDQDLSKWQVKATTNVKSMFSKKLEQSAKMTISFKNMCNIICSDTWKVDFNESCSNKFENCLYKNNFDYYEYFSKFPTTETCNCENNSH